LTCAASASAQQLGTLPRTLPGSEAPKVSPLPPAGAIDVSPIGGPDAAATGLVSSAAAGLPADLWRGSAPARLAALMSDMPSNGLPAAQDLFRTLLLLEARPPDGDTGDVLLHARVDTLIRLGEVEAALALLERAGPDTPDLFRRWFDALLLSGAEDRGCATLAAKPELAPDYQTRVFCLARSGRWPTAALTLETATALQAITPEARDRMARFLDPDLFEGLDPAPVPDPVTPLDYRVLEAIGEPVPHAALPLAYARADLRHVVGWKSQIEAAERLTRAGSLDPNVLLGIYTARRPAASGGVWDRVALIQRLDVALSAGSSAGVTSYLPAAYAAMHQAHLDAVLARLVGPRLARIALEGDTAGLAQRLILASNSSAAFGPMPAPGAAPALVAAATALATGQPLPDQRLPPSVIQISEAMTGDPTRGLDPDDTALLASGRTGEALLLGLSRLAPDADADTGDVADTLRLLRTLGFDRIARQVALQYLMLDTRG
jgi:hypothetical protein